MLSNTARTVAVAGIVAASLGTMTATAAAGDGGNNPMQAATAAYKAAFPKLTDAQARAAAAGSDARRAVYDAAAADAASFGGAWFDPATGIVNLAGTTDAAIGRAAALGKKYGVAVKPYKVKRQRRRARGRGRQLRAGKGELGREAQGNVGVDVKTNEVVVAVPADRRAALAARGVARHEGRRRARHAGPAGRRLHLALGVRLDDPRRRDHVALEHLDPVVLGRLHRAHLEQHALRLHRRPLLDRQQHQVGHRRAEHRPDVVASLDSGAIDAAIIKVTNSWFTGDLGGEIYFEDGGARTAPVKGVAPTVGYMVAGETVCLAANFTQPSATNPCGILGTNSDAGVRGMARVDGVDACGGDSGGGWYWLPSSGNRYAYGIHSRSDSGCHGRCRRQPLLVHGDRQRQERLPAEPQRRDALSPHRVSDITVPAARAAAGSTRSAGSRRRSSRSRRPRPPARRAVRQDAPMPTIADAREQWTPEGVYLNTASYGLPPRDGFDALQSALADWRTGRTSWEHWGESADASPRRSRRWSASTPGRVAIGSTVSGFMGLAAASLPAGANVLVPDVEFTSTLFPFLVQEPRGVRVTTVEPSRLAEAIDASTDVVACSAVQMSSGEVADLDAIAAAAAHHGATTVIDATQACGWMPIDASRFGAVVCARLQVADVASRQRVHGRRRRLAGADRPAQRGLVRG